MNVLVDTSVWSLALRRRREDLNDEEKAVVKELHALIESDRARIPGVVRQELLSGIRTGHQFENLRENLGSFADVDVTTADYTEAAKLGNACRAKGISTSLVDMLLCAVAKRRDWEIFSTDPDFDRYSKLVEMRLHEI